MRVFYSILLALFVFFIFSCKSEKKEFSIDTDKKVLLNEISSLKQQQEDKDNLINGFALSIAEISSSLETIKKKQEIISINTLKENGETSNLEQINKDLNYIDKLLEHNKKLISNLENQLSSSINNSKELQATINTFSKIISTKTKETAELRNNLLSYRDNYAEIETKFSNAKETIDQQSQKILKLENQINTVYYIVGDKRTLKRKNVIENSEGIVGITGINVMAEKFDLKNFTKVNKHELRSLKLNCKQAKLITNHSSRAYKFDGPNNHINNLIITRPEIFWGTSKYLIVLIEN